MGSGQLHENRSYSASDLSSKNSENVNKSNSCVDMLKKSHKPENVFVNSTVPYQDSGILKRLAPGETSGYYSRRFHPRDRQYHSLPHHYKLPILCGQFSKDSDRGNNAQSGYSTKLSLVLDWFKGFNSDQKNKLLMLLLNECEQPQNHLLSTLLQDKLHMSCPPNCQDFLLWLPTVLAYKILSYLDPVSLAKCSQVCKYWHSLSSAQFLWQNLAMQSTWKLSQTGHLQHLKQINFNSDGDKKISWKKVFSLARTFVEHTLKNFCRSLLIVTGCIEIGFEVSVKFELSKDIPKACLACNLMKRE